MKTFRTDDQSFKQFKNKQRVIEFIIFLILLILGVSAKSQNLEFINNIAQTNTSGLSIQQILADASGNVYVLGHFDASESVDFDPSAGASSLPGTPTTDAWTDVFLAKYDAAGNYQWVVGIYSTGVDPQLGAAGIELDASGNIYLVGHVDGIPGATIHFAASGSQSVQGSSSLGNDYRSPFITKIDTNGQEVWTSNPVTSVTQVNVHDLALSSSDVLITGRYANGTPMNLPANSPATVDNHNTFVAAFDQGTGSLSSSERVVTAIVASSVNHNEAFSIDVDGSDNIYLTGRFFNNTEFDPSAGSTQIDGGAGGSLFIAKYNSSYALQWADDGNSVNSQLKIASDGNAWVSGSGAIEKWSSGGVKSAISISVNNDDFALDSNSDIYVVDEGLGSFQKYNGSTGSLVIDENLKASNLFIDAGDNVYVGGTLGSAAEDFDFGAGIFNKTRDGSTDDRFLAVYNTSTDSNAPSFTSFSPADGTDHIAVGADLVLTFDEPVRPLSNSASLNKQLHIRKKADNSSVVDVNVYSSEVSFSGNDITIDLTADLPDDTHLYVWFDDGMFIDYAGNEASGISNGDVDTWDFSTGDILDTDPPIVSSFFPSDDATGISILTGLTLTFDEDIQPSGSGSLVVKRYDNNATVKVVDITTPSSAATYSGHQLIIDLEAVAGSILFDTQYYVEIPSGLISDLAGNAFGNLGDKDTWNFTTGSNTPPVVTSLSPLDEAVDVQASGQTFSVTFDESIFAHNIDIELYESPSTLLEAFTSSDVTISGNTASFTPTVTMNNSTGHYITVASGSFVDATGSSHAGLTSTFDWNFTTAAAETDPPVVSSLLPVDNAIDIAVDNFVFTITFDEDVQVSTGTSGTRNVELIRSSDDLTLLSTGSFNTDKVSIVDNVVTIDYNFDGSLNGFSLDELTEYHIEIGPNAFEDLLGNKFPGIVKPDWSFTTASTADLTPPSISTLNPTDNASDISVDNWLYEVTFDEAVVKGTGFVRLRIYSNDGAFATANLTQHISVSGSTATIDFNALGSLDAISMSESTQYYIEIEDGVFEDMAGNAFTGHSKDDWDFTTEAGGDVTPPTVTLLTPLDDATDISVTNWMYTVDFDEDIQAGSGLIYLKRSSDDAVYGVATPGSARAIISGSQLSIDFNADGSQGTSEMDMDTDHYLEIPSGAIEDLSGNGFTGIAKPDWSFTTEAADVTAPAISSLDPLDDATDVPVDNWVYTITFDEAVQAGSGTVRLKIYSSDGTFTTGSLAQHVSISGNTATIDFNALGNLNAFSLNNETRYYIEVEDGTFEDLAGNAYTGHSKDDWDFTTKPPTPMISSLYPADDATNVSTSQWSYTIDYDNPVQVGNGLINLKRIDNDQVFASADVLGSKVIVTGSQVLIDFNADASLDATSLDVSTEYYIEIAEGRLEDLSGDELEGIAKLDWSFTTVADDTAPSIVSLNPVDDASDIAVDNWVYVVTFDEPIQTGSENVILKQYSTDGTFAFGNIVQHVSISGNVATIDFNALGSLDAASLNHETRYYIAIEDGAFEDLTGNPFVGHSKDDWDFTTEEAPDTTPPAITSLNPSHGATGVAIDTDLVLTFDEDVQLGSSGTFEMFDASDDSQIGATWSFIGNAVVAGNQVTYDIPIDLPSSTDVYFIISGGIEDLAGNSFAGTDESSWSFTTKEKLDQTITFNLLDDKIFGDSDFNLSATASSGLAVSYMSLNPSVATIIGSTVTIHGAGTTNITTSQSGDATYNPAIDVMQVLTVLKADQLVTIDPVPDKLTTDGPFTVNAQTTSGLTLEYSIASGPASISGTTVTLDAVSGMVILEVSQAGNVNYNGTSESISFNISDPAKTDQTISFDAIADKTFGDTSFGLVASATSALAVDLSVVSGPISITGNEVMITGAGTAIISANQSGDGTFNPAPEVTQTFIINKAVQSISFNEIADKIFDDDPFTINASASSGQPVTYGVVSGPVSVSGATVTISGAGVATIAVNQAGNENYLPADEVTQSFTIGKANQTISINPVADKLIIDDPFDISASVDTGLELTYEVIGPASISGTTISLDGSSGVVTVTVSQLGNENYHSTSQSISFDVINPSKMDQTITFDPIANKTYGDPSFELVTSASSGLSVQLSVISGPVSISGSTVSLNGAGDVTLAASQTGDDDYNAASEVTQSFTITKANQIISIDPVADKLTTDDPFDVTATTNSGLQLSYEVIGLASIAGATVTLDGTAGTITVTVSQEGDSNYNAASESITFEVTEETALAIDNKLIEVKIYPNPVSDFIFIESNEAVSAQLFDLRGKLLKNELAQPGKMDVRNIIPGVYLIEITSGNHKIHKRIVKTN